MTTYISSIHDSQFVNRAAHVGSEPQELVDVLQRIVQNAGALLEVQNCSLALLDATQSTLVTMAALQKHGHKLRQTRFQLNEGVAGWVAEHREPLIINDVSTDQRFKRLGRAPVGSIMCVPLIDNDNFIGTLTASSQETNAFDAQRARMLTIFADQAVLAITNARHAELARRQASQLEMLMHLSRGITTSLEPDALYRTILADVRCMVSCEQAVIYLYQERTQELYPVAEWSQAEVPADSNHEDYSSGIKTAQLQCAKINLYNTQSIPALAAAHHHPMLCVPAHALPGAENTSVIPTYAELAAPFVSKGTLYGVLSLQRNEPFNSEELRLVRNLSNMAAAALENVILFQTVRADQEQLRAILTASSDGIALLGVEANFVEVNAAFGRIFGMKPEQIIGMECMELFGCTEELGTETCKELCMIQRALQQEEALPYIEIDLHIHGSVRSVGLSLTPVPISWRPLCLMVARDVTAIRDATRMKANFLSMITHELRSPLNAINGYLDLALTGIAGELNDQQRDFLRRSRAGSEHLYSLVEDLLLVSRADSGQLRLSRDIISLRDVIDNALEEMELNILDHCINVEVEIARDFPRLYADSVRLQQVLRNLISNALRFTETSGRVVISAQVEERENSSSDDREQVILLKVCDTGCGIAPEHIEHIFDRFYQVPSAIHGRSGGQGLGLAIVKMIIELHGGSVMVESVPGQGSTFTCILPCLLS